MFEQIEISLETLSDTAKLAASLPGSWYSSSVTVGLSGDLGAGKTAVVQQLAAALGVKGQVTSPTFALEQRYQGTAAPLIHIDLYRLDSADSRDVLAQSDGESGVRCIEWIERIGSDYAEYIDLHLDIKLQDGKRIAVLTWYDEQLIADDTVNVWRQEVSLPQHIANHCDTVAEVAGRLADLHINQQTAVRKKTLITAARCHDLLRFLDFKPDMPSDAYPDITPGANWPDLKERFSGLSHEAAVSQWLRDKGYPVSADIVALHGVKKSPDQSSTIEQKLLYYADKRVALTDIVTIDERFADFQERYQQPTPSAEALRWFDEVRAIEKHLFPDGPPVL